jgi:hypothetical protein
LGRKFDARLPDMTDEELYDVVRSTLDKKSQEKLDKEIAKRERNVAAQERAAEKHGNQRGLKWTKIGALVGVVSVVIAVIGLIALFV